MRVCLQLFAFDEPQLSETMERWADDPAAHDVDYWACVTPKDGDTLQQAEDDAVFDAVECPPGKLSSRNMAHNMAVGEYDVIAVTDADAYPIRERAVDALVEPYTGPEVAATNGFPTEHTSPLGAIITAFERVGNIVTPHLNGQFSSFRAAAWDEIRDFDEGVDQTDGFQVRQEEEFWLFRALSEQGRIMPAENAHVYNDPRRWKARLRDIMGLPQDDYGSRRGVETFERRK